jgi:hypothetical protein
MTTVQSPRLTSRASEQLYARAHAAGMAAGEAARPTPMVVTEHRNPLDDSSPVIRTYAPVMSGVCGFAWVTVRPATSSFARYLKARGHRRGYEGGIQIWVGEFGQSMERKEAYARAFAAVLREAGITAYAASRMD